MKTITLTSNEALVLIAEGMTMNNVKSLANKLRNADAPVAATNTQFTQYDNEVVKQNLKLANQQVYDYERALEKTKAQSKTWEQSYHDAMVNLEKAKQTESTLRKALAEEGERLSRMTSKIRDLENDARQDAESLTYFRKWVEDFRIKAGYAEGVTPATVFSDVMESLKQNKEACKRAADLESKLVKANDVIANVKGVYDSAHDYAEIMVDNIKVHVEAYYRGN
ncbi:hypothetical protein Pondi_00050 [Escherichia phage Pondi]|nr:hypothetical protein Pondi_00050 [Escherichia phage Pondi]